MENINNINGNFNAGYNQTVSTILAGTNTEGQKKNQLISHSSELSPRRNSINFSSKALNQDNISLDSNDRISIVNTPSNDNHGQYSAQQKLKVSFAITDCLDNHDRQILSDDTLKVSPGRHDVLAHVGTFHSDVANRFLGRIGRAICGVTAVDEKNWSGNEILHVLQAYFEVIPKLEDSPKGKNAYVDYNDYHIMGIAAAHMTVKWALANNKLDGKQMSQLGVSAAKLAHAMQPVQTRHERKWEDEFSRIYDNHLDAILRKGDSWANFLKAYIPVLDNHSSCRETNPADVLGFFAPVVSCMTLSPVIFAASATSALANLGKEDKAANHALRLLKKIIKHTPPGKLDAALYEAAQEVICFRKGIDGEGVNADSNSRRVRGLHAELLRRGRNVEEN
jgi:hypothetical protein